MPKITAARAKVAGIFAKASRVLDYNGLFEEADITDAAARDFLFSTRRCSEILTQARLAFAQNNPFDNITDNDLFDAINDMSDDGELPDSIKRWHEHRNRQDANVFHGFGSEKINDGGVGGSNVPTSKQFSREESQQAAKTRKERERMNSYRRIEEKQLSRAKKFESMGIPASASAPLHAKKTEQQYASEKAKDPKANQLWHEPKPQAPKSQTPKSQAPNPSVNKPPERARPAAATMKSATTPIRNTTVKPVMAY